MRRPTKKMTKKEYIKFYLSNYGKYKQSTFCKYNSANYWSGSLSKSSLKFFRTKCSNCIHSIKYQGLKKEKTKQKYYWFRDNFKPLYNWEPEKTEKGENNGNS